MIAPARKYLPSFPFILRLVILSDKSGKLVTISIDNTRVNITRNRVLLKRKLNLTEPEWIAGILLQTCVWIKPSLLPR